MVETKHFISVKAKCPFYKHESTSMVYCEGINEGSTIHIAFCDNTKAKAHKLRFCYSGFRECPIYKIKREGNNDV